MKKRCEWANSDALYIDYHDLEWGVPVHDDRRLFEFIVLEGAQAGLSWITILRRREEYRKAFDDFNPRKVASYDEEKVKELLGNPGIIRNRLKINSAIKNAIAFQDIQEEYGGFDEYSWSFVGGRPIRNRWRTMGEIPATSQESNAMSKDMKKRGFSFFGPTICYAHMQAVGMVNDHVMDCFRYDEV